MKSQSQKNQKEVLQMILVPSQWLNQPPEAAPNEEKIFE